MGIGGRGKRSMGQRTAGGRIVPPAIASPTMLRRAVRPKALLSKTMVKAGAVALLMLAVAIPLVAQEPKEGEELPILFTADQLTYDQEQEIVRAIGHVEVDYDERILLADRITYVKPQDLVVAEGNVALMQATGEVLFADRVEVTGDLKDGVLDNLRAVLADGSRFAAVGGRRSGGTVTEMRKAVYSPCDLCAEDPQRAPLWQVKAVKVVHDQDTKTIEYEDAWVEVAGLPVLYTPYLSHPDPSVKRKTGLLIPLVGGSSDLGFLFGAPFYWVIDDTKDATITPIYTGNEGPVLALEYRQALRHGWLSADGSGTVDTNNDVRGNIFSEFRYDINERWRGGIDLNRTSDDTYLRRYGFGDDARTLTSRGFLEGFYGRDYVNASAYSFQSLEQGVNDDTLPIVAPLANYNFVSGRDPIGGQTMLDLNLAVLSRREGTDTRRLSGRAEWVLPLRDGIGSLYEISASLWADGYNVEDGETEDGSDSFTGFTGRLWPQAAVEWRWPWMKDGEIFDQVIQPVAQVVVAPVGGNPEEIPNEDSQDVEIDVNNVISINRFPGLDRVEDGTRFNYGLEWQAFTDGNGSASAFIGQSYRLQAESALPPSSGLSGNLSDIVTNIDVGFSPWLTVGYRARIKTDDFSFTSNEVYFGGGVPALTLSGSYLYFEQEPGSEYETRNEIALGVSSQLTRYWRGRVYGLRDLTEDPTQLTLGVGFTYEDECFLFDGSWVRERFRDQDIEPSNTFLIRLGLKTLGEAAFSY